MKMKFWVNVDFDWKPEPPGYAPKYVYLILCKLGKKKKKKKKKNRRAFHHNVPSLSKPQ